MNHLHLISINLYWKESAGFSFLSYDKSDAGRTSSWSRMVFIFRRKVGIVFSMFWYNTDQKNGTVSNSDRGGRPKGLPRHHDGNQRDRNWLACILLHFF